MGLFRSVKRFLFGRKPRFEQKPTVTSSQSAALDRLLSQGLSETDASAMQELFSKKFSEETVPGLAEQFTGMGGGQAGSAFQSTLGRAGSDLQSQLAAMQAQQGLQKLQFGLQPRVENIMHAGAPGFMQNVIAPAVGAMGAGLAGGGGIGLAGLLGSLLASKRKGSGQQATQYAPGQPQGYAPGGGYDALRQMFGNKLGSI